MSKKKGFFITFEGIEGSGKTYQSKKLFNKISNMGISSIYTREPGGTVGAERIRKIILEDYFSSKGKQTFNKYTDTLLYMAARSEHISEKLKPHINKKKVIICDRFIDSTIAYQVYGKGVDINLVNSVHKHILSGITPDLTFILKAKISKVLERLKKRKTKNRYDKFSRDFYAKVQKAFLKIGNRNKRKYKIIDNSIDSPETEKLIYKEFLKLLNRWE